MQLYWQRVAAACAAAMLPVLLALAMQSVVPTVPPGADPTVGSTSPTTTPSLCPGAYQDDDYCSSFISTASTVCHLQAFKFYCPQLCGCATCINSEPNCPAVVVAAVANATNDTERQTACTTEYLYSDYGIDFNSMEATANSTVSAYYYCPVSCPNQCVSATTPDASTYVATTPAADAANCADADVTDNCGAFCSDNCSDAYAWLQGLDDYDDDIEQTRYWLCAYTFSSTTTGLMSLYPGCQYICTTHFDRSLPDITGFYFSTDRNITAADCPDLCTQQCGTTTVEQSTPVATTPPSGADAANCALPDVTDNCDAFCSDNCSDAYAWLQGLDETGYDAGTRYSACFVTTNVGHIDTSYPGCAYLCYSHFKNPASNTFTGTMTDRNITAADCPNLCAGCAAALPPPLPPATTPVDTSCGPWNFSDTSTQTMQCSGITNVWVPGTVDWDPVCAFFFLEERIIECPDDKLLFPDRAQGSANNYWNVTVPPSRNNLDHFFGVINFVGETIDGDAGVVNSWDVSNVTSLSYTFATSGFNLDVSDWDVSSVTDMSRAFACNKQDTNTPDTKDCHFNQDLTPWGTSAVTDFGFMFADNAKMATNVGQWDLSNGGDTVATMLGNYSDGTEACFNYWHGLDTYCDLHIQLVNTSQAMPQVRYAIPNFSDPGGNHYTAHATDVPCEHFFDQPSACCADSDVNAPRAALGIPPARCQSSSECSWCTTITSPQSPPPPPPPPASSSSPLAAAIGGGVAGVVVVGVSLFVWSRGGAEDDKGLMQSMM